jgi:DNA-binding Lrp family transcriptional regulator
VDSKDFRLLVALHRDARQSYQALGRTVGLTAPAVRSRLQHIREGGILPGYGLWVDPGVFGRRELLVFFREERQRPQVLEMLRQRDVAWIGWKLDGGLSIGIWTSDEEESVRRLEAALGEKSYARAATPSSGLSRLSKTDCDIVDSLAHDPTVPFGDIVAATGLSPKTVRKHLSALQESETIVVMPLIGVIPGSGDLVYQLAVVGTASVSAIRAVIGDAILLHRTQTPSMQFLLCRSSDIAEVSSKTKEVGRLPGVDSVNLSLNRELLFAPKMIHSLVAERRKELGP